MKYNCEGAACIQQVTFIIITKNIVRLPTRRRRRCEKVVSAGIFEQRLYAEVRGAYRCS